MNNHEKPSFFDPKTLIVVLAVASIYLGWQVYLQKKYPNYGKQQAPAVATSAPEKSDTNVASAVSSESNTSSKVGQEIASSYAATVYTPTFIDFKSEKLSFKLNSHGMGLKDVTINHYSDHDKNPIKVAKSEKADLFQVQLNSSSSPIQFVVTQIEDGHFIGKALVGSTEIERELKYNASNNSFTNKITIKNPTQEFLSGFNIVIPDTKHVAKNSSILFPSMEFQDFVVEENGKIETVHIMGAKENVQKEIATSPLVSVSSHYFTSAVLDKSDITPKVSLSADVTTNDVLAKLNFVPAQLKDQFVFEQTLYVGPKSMDALNAVDAHFSKLIDFGFFGFIAIPLLHLLKVCFAVVGNWGWAIILLTLIVRTLVLPFNIMSFKSMKAMQKIQPEVQKLREKFKEDPMRLNQEMMALMKREGANPMGSCLPMLLQIPVFFALYKVINSSIELYQSPFMFWITDLSLHDKFYVLPILMGASMYLQQKMTPSTMDPTQAKIMAFMPVVFSLFMLNLPSGLTLYMFVSTLFGITQQYLMMRDKNPVSK